MESIVKFDSFDHFGLVVKDVKAASESWSAKLGISEWRYTPGDVVKLAHAFSGTAQYELIEPVEGKESLWADFLKERGEGLHHICHQVDDVDKAAADLVEAGGTIMTSIPKWMAYVEIGGPGSVILELLRSRNGMQKELAKLLYKQAQQQK